MIAALFILKSLAVGMVALLMLWALRRSSAATRHRTCLIGLLALVALPFVSISGWQMPLQVPDSPGAISVVAEPFTTVVKQPSVTTELPEPAQPIFLPAPGAQPKTSLPLWPLWLIGAVICSIRPLAGALQARLLIRNAEPASPDLLALANNCACEQKVSGKLRVLTSNEVESALAWGHLRPVVMLPSSASSWSEDDLRTIFLHELAHIARGDWLAQAFASAVCSLYWFNPFAWALSARLRKEAERAADDLVLRCGVAPEAYAYCLIQIARQLRRRPRPAGVAPILDPTQIENRIRGIMSKKINRGGITPLRSLAIAATVACVALPLAAVLPYRLEFQTPKAETPVRLNVAGPSERVSSKLPLRVDVSEAKDKHEESAEVKTLSSTRTKAAQLNDEPDKKVISPQGGGGAGGGNLNGASGDGGAGQSGKGNQDGQSDLQIRPYVVDLAGIAKRDEYGTYFIRDSFAVVTPNLEHGLKDAKLEIGAWPKNNPEGTHKDGGCFAPVGYDGFVVLPEGQRAIDWDRIEVKVLDGQYVALVVPQNLTEALVEEAVRSLRATLKTNNLNLDVQVLRPNGRGYIFLPGNKDFLGAQAARVAAYDEKYRGIKPRAPESVEGLSTKLPPSNFDQIRAAGFIWIRPNTVVSKGKRHLLDRVTGGPKGGGASAYVRTEGFFIRQPGVLDADYSDAETILINGEYTLLVVPEDVDQDLIDTTIEEVYRWNNTNAQDSPIKVVRQRKNGLIVLPGPNDELMLANAAARKSN